MPKLGKKTKIAVGAVAGLGAVAAAPVIAGGIMGVSATGPVAGGLFASGQAAGYSMAGLQSWMMAGATTGTYAAGAAGGAFAGSRV